MVHAVLPGARLRMRVLTIGALALTCGALLAGSARAATPPPSAVTCSGHANRGVDATLPDQIDFLFACSGAIKSYTVISSAPIGLFNVGSTVFEHGVTTIVETDSFFCEGLIPGDGFNCTGQAAIGHDVVGDFETFDPVCGTTVQSPRLKLQIVVADANGATAGPFRLRGPAACPKAKPVKDARKNRRKAVKKHAQLASVRASAASKTVITMSGSTSVAPLAAKLAKAYVKSHKGVGFKLLQGGSDVGINDVAHGRVTIGDSSRDPKPTDPSGLVFNKIARDAVCLISNTSNPVGNLSTAQVQSLFSGGVRSWSGVPGAVGGTVDLIGRTAASGTYDAFNKIFMGGKALSTTMAQKASNGLVQQKVQSDKNAIGYVSLAFTAGAHSISYNGVPCTLRNAKSGQYGGVRNFFMVTRGPAKGATRKWIKWIQTSRVAKRIVASDWVPLA